MVLQYRRGLRRYFSQNVRHSDDLPDLMQEVYLRLLRVNHQENIRNPEAYLITMARHVLYEYWQVRNRDPLLFDIRALRESARLAEQTEELEKTLEPVLPEGEDPAAKTYNFQRFQEIVAGLPPRMGAALVLHRIYGYTVPETAKAMGISRETVKGYLADAVERCRKIEYGDAHDE